MPAPQPSSSRPDHIPPEDDEPSPAEAGAPEPLEVEAPDAAEPAGPTRRERRAAARGGAAVKVAGPAVGRRPPVPAKHRDYASRRRG